MLSNSQIVGRPCGGGIITRFILADVAGHGTCADEMARSLRDLMRRNINRKSQARLVKEINRQFTELAKLQRFATALVGTYLAAGDRLKVCNAGHPRPFWYRATARQWSILGGQQGEGGDPLANLPLGIDESLSFSQIEIVLQRGDLVFFYTDALTEASNHDGCGLGEAGLFAMMRDLDVSDPANVSRELVARLDAYRGGKPAEDDLTFLLLHHNAGGPPRLTLGQTLRVYAKVFGLERV